ncbi:GntR family transcriptional regulator [Kocuria arenosa]|uniref:GntR family transcriptional regulator n=1 Tax=Kocuria arenosa TaxID=3071446 RepID=UPI0034D69C5B
MYEVLRSRIMSGTYEPGEHLVAADISGELGVSRSPVRVALQRLAEDGLVTTEANRGAFVSQWTRSDIHEVFDLRQMLEARGARLAAQFCTPEDAAELCRSVDEMTQIFDERAEDYRDRLHRNNQEFHLKIVMMARSPRTFQFVKELTDTSLTLGTFFHYSDHDISRSVDFHRDLAKVISARNAVAAESIMSAHLCLAHMAFDEARFTGEEG